MNLQEFKASLQADMPPQGLDIALQALWHAGKNDWHASHDTLQDDNTAAGSWVHAYLHRDEGDIPNARYWYSRAGKTLPDISLEAEWEAIAETLLAR